MSRYAQNINKHETPRAQQPRASRTDQRRKADSQSSTYLPPAARPKRPCDQPKEQ